MMNTIESIIDKVKECASQEHTLKIAGAGSKSFWVNVKADETLDMTQYTGVIDYEPSELVVTVKAGTRLSELNALLNQNGQMLAFEPPTYEGNATVGGMVATGLSGPRRAYQGSTRDFVLGLRVIDGVGNDLHFGGRVIKNVAGFDASRLMVGALGSLGVITEVSLKVIPKPTTERTLCFSMTEGRAIQAMNEWAGKPLPLSASSFSQGELRIRLSGAEVAVNAAQQELGGELLPQGQTWWQSLQNQTVDCIDKNKPLWRLSVKSIAAPLGLSGQCLIEWGGALRWVNSDHHASQIFKVAKEAGGHAQLFRQGDPFHPQSSPLSEVLIPIHQRLKNNFDPKGILNPGLPGQF